jgi:carbonic anhydrase/acetyltransferase-like protein (isoleucine patch superfamily)
MPLGELQPEISVDSYVAPNAAVIGDVFVNDKASVWYAAVIRGMFVLERCGRPNETPFC